MTTDPFDRLHVLVEVDPDVQPDPRFVARLRARVASALTLPPTTSRSSTFPNGVPP